MLNTIIFSLYLFSVDRYGWPLRKDEKTKTNRRDPFHDFENKTSDAWDDGDDDLMQMAHVKISVQDAQSSAKLVLANHSKKTSPAMSLKEADVKVPLDLHQSEDKSILCL